jgi:alpha-glucosidase
MGAIRPNRRAVLGAVAAVAPLVGGWCGAEAALPKGHKITSPDGQVEVALFPPAKDTAPTWAARAYGKSVLERGALALMLADGTLLGPGATIERVGRASHRGVWEPPFSTARRFDESYNELVLHLKDARRQIRFAIVVRVHDHGIALRYRIEAAPQKALRLSGEATQFRLPAGSRVWSSRDEGEYAVSTPGAIDPVPDPPLTKSSDAGPMADLPLTVVTSEQLVLSIAESDRFDYPRLAFRPGPGADSVISHLMRFPGRATGWSGPGDTPPELSFAVTAPFATPWRVVTVARSDAELVDRSGLPAIFASPSRLKSAGWIKPGKAIRVRVPYTTERALRCVDFARRHKLAFIEFDAHWYGDGTDPSDASVAIPALDMARIVRTARAADVGVILYVDRVPAMRQLPAILRRYREWGVAGIKFGFMWEGRQQDVRFINRLVQACGEAGLLVSLHDDLRPAGLERTWPNYVALEGVRGNEHFPTARHNVTLPFTRCVAGPIDYTICYAQDRNRTTNAHQLAAAVVYYSPLAFLYWYDEPAKFDTGHWDELAWFDECPTIWDESRALSGAIGEHVAIARRSGERWFLGAMTNGQARTLELPLAFLGTGRWKATLFTDGEAAQAAWRTPVLIGTREVGPRDMLQLRLAPSGGAAVLLSPA